MRAEVVALVGPLLLAAGCSRPDALVICHNANCAEPADPARDDTLAALRESLALRDAAGDPVIDGVELDSFWRGADDTCLYAHDLANLAEDTPASAPADELAAYFAQPGPISSPAAGDRPFEVLLELKSHVSEETGDRHTPAQRAAHAACAWDIYTRIAAAALTHERAVRVTFEAFAPELLRAVIDTTPPMFPTTRYRFGVVQGIPAPLDDQTRPLGDYAGLPIGLVELHAQWVRDTQFEAIRGMDADLALFMFSATVETLAAVEQYEPTLIVTNEAQFFRRWLAD